MRSTVSNWRRFQGAQPWRCPGADHHGLTGWPWPGVTTNATTERVGRSQAQGTGREQVKEWREPLPRTGERGVWQRTPTEFFFLLGSQELEDQSAPCLQLPLQGTLPGHTRGFYLVWRRGLSSWTWERKKMDNTTWRGLRSGKVLVHHRYILKQVQVGVWGGEVERGEPGGMRIIEWFGLEGTLKIRIRKGRR